MGTPLLQPRPGGPKTAAAPSPLLAPSPSFPSMSASSPAVKRVAATRPVASFTATAAKQDTLPNQFRGWSFRPPSWIYEARPDAVGEERHRPATRQRDESGVLRPFLTAQLVSLLMSSARVLNSCAGLPMSWAELIAPFSTAALSLYAVQDYCRDRYISMCDMLEAAEDRERQTVCCTRARQARAKMSSMGS